MTDRIKSILLIDDDEATIFYYKIIIDYAGCKAQVDVATNGKKAIEYIHSRIEKNEPLPDLTFLDINMPVMNGWGFMDAYSELPEVQKSKMVIVMLTSSLNPDDEENADRYSDIAEFRIKPLTADVMEELSNKNFK